MSNSTRNNSLESFVVGFLLFPSLWVKILFSFSASEEENRGWSYILFSSSDIAILFSLILWWLIHPPETLSKLIIFLALVLLFLNIPTLLLVDNSILLQLRLTLKLTIPILFFACMLEFSIRHPNLTSSLTKMSVFVVVICTLCGLYYLPPEYNRGIQWMAGYFSGLHSSAYIWVGMFIALSGVAKNELTRAFIWLSIFLFITFSWGVRAAEGALILFALFYIFDHIKDLRIKVILSTVIIIAILPIALKLFLDPLFGELMNKWSSGRLGMYGEKLEQISSSSTLALLFGGGAGSDLIISDTWWWGKRGSHNDFITILVEQGVFYFCAFLTLLVIITRSFRDVHLRGILYIYVFSSVISNGFMVRPMAAYILFLAGVYASQCGRLREPKISRVVQSQLVERNIS